MKFLDFEFDGLYLSDFGFIACSFDASSGTQTLSAGSKLSFSKVSHNRGRYYSTVNSTYNDCLTATFDICKSPDIYTTQPEMIISNDEFRDIMRWLNRREFCTFRIIPDDCSEDDVDTCSYNASFNIDKIKVAEDLVGLRLTVETDKPFGYGQEVQKTLTFTSSVTEGSFFDWSDEVGDHCVDLIITITDGGDLVLANDTLGLSMEIKDCVAGEVITILGKEQIITTSESDHDICDDFNYEFLKICNTYYNRKNVITCTLPCEVEILYEPIIKDTP